MPRYFFNLRYGPGPDKLAVDPEGDDLASVEEAHQHALQSIRSLIAGPPSHAVRDWFVCSLEITDEAGRPIMTVPFTEVVPIEDDEEGED